MRRSGLGLAVALLLLPAAPASADEIRDGQWHVTYLDLPTAHEITRGEGQTIAMLDTGVDARHPDLRAVLRPGIDLVEPANQDAWTPEEHGTLVAGVLGGQGHGPGGGDGVLGVAPGATILPIRAASDAGDQPTSQLVAGGIRRAVARGASVISISLSSEYSALDEYAIAAARRSDVVVVAAAGNLPDAQGVTFPAALPTVVAVGGVDADGGVAEFSVTGPEIALTAPADEIVTTSPGGEYAVATGTSLAAPVVAGAAALVRARYPALSADEVIHRLVSTAADGGPAGDDEQYGHGIVDVVAALTAEVPPMPAVPDEPDRHRRGQWQLDALDVPAAHAVTRGEGVTVALVGSGVDGSHPDLHHNVLPGVDLAEPGNDDAWTPTASGTALAGIIAGHGNRLTDHQPGNRGALGLAPAAALLPVRVDGPGGGERAAVARAAEGIEAAVAGGAQVICYAGGRATEDLFAEAVGAAVAADAVVVAGAAGGGDGGGEVWFPAANPAVLAVAGLDRDGSRLDGAATGPEVALAAPAGGLVSSAPEDGYAEVGDAQAAAAVVAGAAALVRAAHPELTAAEVVHRLLATAADAGPPGRDDAYGHGALRLVEALTADVPPARTPTAGPTGPDRGGAAPPPDERDFGLLRAVVLAGAGATVLVGLVALVALRVRRRRAAAGGGPGADHEA